MEVIRCSSPEEFLAATSNYREREPIRTNVMGSVAVSVVKKVRTYDAYWWWVLRDGTEVVGAAFRTAPFGLQLGPMPRDGATLLAASVANEDLDFPWLGGPEAVVTAFLNAYSAAHSLDTSREFVPGRTSLLYEVEEISFPTVDGYSRDATLSDFDLVNAWTNDFIKFIDDAHHTPTEADLETLRHRISANSRKLWIDHDEPVSMAGHAEAVETPGGLVTRIGPVYTPDNFRGRGYGSAVTAALSDELLRGGSRVMLYADQANPTSNSIYQTIGYRLLDHVVQYDRATTTHT